jgi:hypothetical protein
MPSTKAKQYIQEFRFLGGEIQRTLKENFFIIRSDTVRKKTFNK